MIFSHFLESGRKSRGPPCPGPGPGLGPSPRPGPGRGRSPSTGQAGGRCRRVRRVRGIGAVGASPRGQAIPVTRRVRAVGASDPLPRGQAILRTRCVRALGASGAPLGAKRFRERAASVRSGPPMRPSGQSNSRNALGPHSGPPIRLLGAKRSRGVHVAPSLLTFAAGVCMVPFRPRAKRQNVSIFKIEEIHKGSVIRTLLFCQSP